MRSKCKIVVMAGVGLLLVPQLASATDVEAQLQRMERRMAEMEQRLDATSDELASERAKVEEQREQLQAAGMAEERKASSALSTFLEQTDMTAWVAASYNYNFNGTENSVMAQGGQNITLAHHPNPNTFQLDQAWIEINKDPTEESRGGFHIDFAAGVATDSAGWTFTDSAGDTVGSSPYAVGIYSAYASYLAPVFDGIRIDGGQLPTILGAEVTQTNANFNITRGIVWGLQPTTNLGFLTTTNFGNLAVKLGMLNEPISNDEPLGFDQNSAKALTSQIAYSGEKFSAAAGVNYGSSSSPATTAANATSNDGEGILDVLLTADPTDNLSAWVNYDYRWGTDMLTGGDQATTGTHGVAAAARLGIIESTGVALRFEWVRNAEQLGTAAAETTNDMYTLTGTVDYSMTDNTTLKGEVRWDRDDAAMLIDRNGNPTEQNQVTLLVQMMYQF